MSRSKVEIKIEENIVITHLKLVTLHSNSVNLVEVKSKIMIF